MNTREPTYQGVSVEHPRIVDAIKNLAKQGKSKDEIRRIVGMPNEVIERHTPKAG